MNAKNSGSPAVASDRVDEWAPIQQRAYALLKGMIDDGRLQPGEKLLEVQIARAFGISRSPVKYALHALHSEKLLQRSAGRGYVVAGKKGVNTGKLASLTPIVLEVAPLWERIYADVERNLCTSIFFGAVRITEEKLAETYGVSRTVVRDVLGRIHSLGLIQKDRAGRWFAPPMTPDRIRDLYELRSLVEPAAFVQSISNVPRHEVIAAGDAVRSTLASLDSAASKDLDKLEEDLHIKLLDSCTNRELIRALRPTRLLLVSNRYVFDVYIGIPRDEIGSALESHLKVIELALQGRTKSAARELQHHLRESCDHWLQRFDTIATNAAGPALAPYLSPEE